MPKRALIERRPWLLGSVLLALAFVWFQDSRLPGVYLLALKAAPLLLLAVYALLRHRGSDTRLLAAMLVCEGIGSSLVDYFPYEAVTLIIIGLGFGIGLFAAHRRAAMTPSQRTLVVLLLLLTPVIAYLLADPQFRQLALFYGLAAGGMTATAWASNFPRYRVGAGAVVILTGNLVAIAAGTDPGAHALLSQGGWALFYLGNLMLSTGVTVELRSRG
jgi:hypothetical protein